MLIPGQSLVELVGLRRSGFLASFFHRSLSGFRRVGLVATQFLVGGGWLCGALNLFRKALASSPLKSGRATAKCEHPQKPFI